MKTCLNLGCGKDYVQSTPDEVWINIDAIRDFKADLYRDLRQHLPYVDNSINHIKAKDIIEHFSKVEIPVIFKDWVRVLKSGGTIEVVTTNIEAIKSFDGELLLDLIFGAQIFSGINTGSYGQHKWSFTPKLLESLFIDNNLKVLELKPCDGTNIFCLGRKK